MFDSFVLAFFALGFVLIRGALRISLVLTNDQIAFTDLWRHTTMRVSDIKGRRKGAGKGGSWTVLIPRDKHQRKIVIKDSFGLAIDDFYRNWLGTIPDLDAIDREQRRKDGKLNWYEQ